MFPKRFGGVFTWCRRVMMQCSVTARKTSSRLVEQDARCPRSTVCELEEFLHGVLGPELPNTRFAPLTSKAKPFEMRDRMYTKSYFINSIAGTLGCFALQGRPRSSPPSAERQPSPLVGVPAREGSRTTLRRERRVQDHAPRSAPRREISQEA